MVLRSDLRLDAHTRNGALAVVAVNSGNDGDEVARAAGGGVRRLLCDRGVRGDSLSVRYELAGRELDHLSYMRELLGAAGGNRFPFYSDDLRAAFSALRYDLEHYCGDFLSGSGAEYLRCWTNAQEDSQRSGVARLARTEHELRDD